MNDKWKTRFELVRGFGWMALVGLFLLILGPFTPSDYARWPLVFGFLLCIPGFLYISLVTIWHWKARYRGNHSDLWGALIFIETTGWLRVVYVFRHLIPDMRRTGRYRDPM